MILQCVSSYHMHASCMQHSYELIFEENYGKYGSIGESKADMKDCSTHTQNV